MTESRSIEVAPDEVDVRLDRWFRRRFPVVSHGHLQKLLRTGQIRVDGRRAKGNARLKPGQMVRVPPNLDDGDAEFRPRRLAIHDGDEVAKLILHRDESVVVINKPSGLAVQGGSRQRRHLDGMLGGLKVSSGQMPKLVHRLDRDTSGVLIVALTASAAAKLASAFRRSDARKTYWAVTVGAPKMDSGRISLPLAKMWRGGQEKVGVNADEGKPAQTDFRVVDKAGEKVAWLELYPRTGRTHQLRVHCAAAGFPILGDGKYGGAEATSFGGGHARALHLHARSLDIPHPNGGRLAVSAPLPRHMRETFVEFGFSEGDADL